MFKCRSVRSILQRHPVAPPAAAAAAMMMRRAFSSSRRTLSQSGEQNQQGFAKPRVERPSKNKLVIPGVEHIVVVASGKGGVGKSTVATNLALALSRHAKVGLLDADIYGPSLHRMMNVREKAELNPETKKLVPKSNFGVRTISMGCVVDEDVAAIWRGPMVVSALDQLLRQVEWGELDIMVVDLPPGTGDIHLSICQNVPVSGAVVVSTPQDIALIDARRAVNMFKKVNVQIFGIVENMSYYTCSNCGNVDHIFGHAGARATAEEMGVDFLGDIPLHVDIRTTSDEGKPITVSDASSSNAAPFFDIARSVLQKLSMPHFETELPKIIIE